MEEAGQLEPVIPSVGAGCSIRNTPVRMPVAVTMATAEPLTTAVEENTMHSLAWISHCSGASASADLRTATDSPWGQQGGGRQARVGRLGSRAGCRGALSRSCDSR